MSKPKIKVAVVSDIVCPWCYIGKRRLEKAIDKLSDKYDFEVEYFPFELNPQMPMEGVGQKQYLSNKFGGDLSYERITAHTTSVAAQEGLKFDFQAQKISPNTRTAHRLIQLAKEDGLHLALVESLFRSYFSEGVDLSRNENLKTIALANGMTESKIDHLLESDLGVAEVQMAEQELQKIGITAIPFYIVNNTHGLSGAQPAETFIRAFEEIATASGEREGETCDVDGQNC